MPFQSLSNIIRGQVRDIEKKKVSSAPIRSASSNYLNPTFVANVNDTEEDNVMVWGNSVWGIQKVTSEYKPQ